MKLYLSLSRLQKRRICHIDVSLDIFKPHHRCQWVIDHLVEWHFPGIGHYGLNGSFPTFRLLDKHIHEQKQDQLTFGADYREETTPHFVEAIECRVADCEEKKEKRIAQWHW